jgi:tetratricopeptide (TPR) repeat protein
LVYFSDVLERALAASEALAIDPFASVRPDLENVRAAIANSINGGDVRRGVTAALAAHRSTSFPLTECLGWLESLLPQLDQGEVRLRAECMTNIAGDLGQLGLSARSDEVAEEALRMARASGDDATLFDALLNQSMLLRRAARLEEALALTEEAEKLLPSAATPLRRVRLLERRGVTAGLSGDLAGAVRDFEDMRTLCRSLGNEEAARTRFINFAEFEHFRGNTSRAIEIAQEAVAAYRRAGYKDGLINTYSNLAAYFIASDRTSEGRVTAAETLRGCIDPNSLFVAVALEHAALAFAIEGDLARAARFSGFAETALAKMQFQREFTEQKTLDRLLRLLAEMPADQLAAARAEGAALSPEAAIDEALAVLEVPLAR